MKHKVNHLHFIGIGGSGMSGIAEVLLNLGYQVSGSDLAESSTVKRLKSLGAKTLVGHAAGNIVGADVVVTSSAVKPDNPEVVAAKAARVPVVPGRSTDSARIGLKVWSLTENPPRKV